MYVQIYGLIYHKITLVYSSVVDPNTLNFYPDPEFWSNLDPGLCYLF